MPHSALPKLKESARQLVEFEVAGAKSADVAAFRVCERLQVPLGKLLGLGGFRALLARSLSLAAADHPWLSELIIKDDSALEGFAALKAERRSTALVEGGVTVVAHLLELLVTFIGPDLTLAVLKEAWPEADCDSLTLEE